MVKLASKYLDFFRFSPLLNFFSHPILKMGEVATVSGMLQITVQKWGATVESP